MSKIPVKIFLDEGATLPSYETEGAAGCDLCSNETEVIAILPGHSAIVGTGIFVEIPPGYEWELRGKSGYAFKHEIQCHNGTIDCDYRGEVKVKIFNLSDDDEVFEVAPGQKICQAVLKEIDQAQFKVVEKKEELGKTDRGDDGFGSTGNFVKEEA